MINATCRMMCGMFLRYEDKLVVTSILIYEIRHVVDDSIESHKARFWQEDSLR